MLLYIALGSPFINCLFRCSALVHLYILEHSALVTLAPIPWWVLGYSYIHTDGKKIVHGRVLCTELLPMCSSSVSCGWGLSNRNIIIHFFFFFLKFTWLSQGLRFSSGRSFVFVFCSGLHSVCGCHFLFVVKNSLSRSCELWNVQMLMESLFRPKRSGCCERRHWKAHLARSAFPVDRDVFFE